MFIAGEQLAILCSPSEELFEGICGTAEQFRVILKST
jgi:hypothetical protein